MPGPGSTILAAPAQRVCLQENVFNISPYSSNMSARLIWPRLFTVLLVIALLAVGGCKKDKDVLDNRTAQELYQDAKSYLDNRAWDRAARTYKQLQTRYPFGRYTEQSMLDLAYAYFKARQPEAALSSLDRFIRTYPTHPNVDYAFYLKGLVNYEENLGFLEKVMPSRVRDRDQTSARDAFIDFSELLRLYPDSHYVPDARQRMVFLRNNLAAYEIAVADFYLVRKAYVAAANRARYVVETYPGTPENSEALMIMHKSYTELSLIELADDAWELLALNYPEHYYVLGKKKKRTWAQRLWPFD